jgi:hypothetical protein
MKQEPTEATARELTHALRRRNPRSSRASGGNRPRAGRMSMGITIQSTEEVLILRNHIAIPCTPFCQKCEFGVK